MDPVRKIQSVAAWNSNLLNAHESYIAQNMNASDNMNELESRFISQCSQMKNMVGAQATQIVNVVQGYYPQRWDPDYWIKREYHQVLSEYACAHIGQMDQEFDSKFSRLNNLFRRLSSWIRNKATQVYSAIKGFFRGAVNRIHGWFS